MIEATTLDLSGERVGATYEFVGERDDVERRAQSLCVEQTIEFPLDLVPDDDIRGAVVGRVESIEPVGADIFSVRVSYAVETTGDELGQLLNVLWGNSSLLPSLRLVDVDIPTRLWKHFGGPRFGLTGLRQLFEADNRPLLATALKPMGLSVDRLARQAHALASGGIDIIKDDHGLANQPFAPFAERIERCAQAVRDANDATGARSIYMPSVTGPWEELQQRLDQANAVGVGGLLVLPGINGFDFMRHAAATSGVPVMAHPALLGSYTVAPHEGIEHGLMYGTLARLAGADLSVFPSFGGRFSFSEPECRSIVDRLRQPIDGIATAVPAPGGGMTLERVPEIIEFYGSDVALLIGGDLHRSDDLQRRAAHFRQVAAVAN